MADDQSSQASTAVDWRSSDEDDLERFGYQQKLRRSMSAFTSFCLAFSMITITGTLVALFQPSLEQVGGVSIWFWLIALAGVFLVLLVFMHMAARIPVTGYAYQWTSRITNAYYGWVVAVFGIITFTTGAVSIGVLLGSVYAPEFGLAATPQNAAYLSAAALTVGVIINVIGIRLTGRVNNFAAIVEIIGTSLLVLLLLVGVLFFFHHAQGFSIISTHGVDGVAGTHLSFVSYILAASLPILSLLGWEASADLAEETQDPRKTAPKAMFRAVVVSGVAGFVVMWIWAAAIKGPLPKALTQQNTFFWVVDVNLSRYAGWFIATVGFISMMGCIIANIAVATRLLFSVSRDRLLPASKQLAIVHPRLKTPVVAITVLWILMVLINVVGAGNIFRIVAMASAAYYFTYGSTMIAVLAGHFKRKIPMTAPGHFGLGRWLVLVTIAALAWCVAVILGYMLPAVNHYVAAYFGVALLIGAAFTVYAWWALKTGRASVPETHIPPEPTTLAGVSPVELPNRPL
jgi:amino acid transporter